MRRTMKVFSTVALLVTSVALGTTTGCGGDTSADRAGGEASVGPTGNTGVGQSGAQDFGRFRGIVEAGEIPASNTLDQVGFFNEHKIELPAPDCGNDVCLHTMLGVQGNMVNGANCTVVLAGFNTHLKPDDFERPPLNMAVAVDVSGSMAGEPLTAVKDGLKAFIDELGEKDKVTLIAYSDEAEVLIESTATTDPDRALLRDAVLSLRSEGSTNIYEGLKEALESVDSRLDAERQNRVILLSDGEATSGVQSTQRIVHLGESYAERGVGITTIGVGDEFDIDLMRGLSDAGAGNFYFLEDIGAVEEVFVEEVKTFLVPLAEDVNIHFDAAEAYSFRAAYGTDRWEGESSTANIHIPALFMASRQTAEDITPSGGRRGGGGMILLELVPTTDTAILEDTGEGAPAGEFTFDYFKPGGEMPVSQTSTVINPLEPGETPIEGEFDNPAVEKAFVALNIYVGFKMALNRVESGSIPAALSVLNPLSENVDEWLEDNDDPDIEDDHRIMQALIETLEEEEQQEPLGTPPNPWPRD